MRFIRVSFYVFLTSTTGVALLGPGVAQGYDYEPQPAKATIMFIGSHPDDEGIFFGGTLGYYTQVRNAPAVSITMTLGEWAFDHSGILNPGQEVKPIEFPETVWRYGFRNEPILPLFQQSNCCSNVNGNANVRSWRNWSNGPQFLDSNDDVALGKQRASRYLAEQIRLYQPDVIAVQDFNGEYGHPDHRAIAKATEAAWDLAAGNDATISDAAGSTLVSATGIPGALWQTKKMYVHKYAQNRLFHDFLEDVTIDSDGNGTLDQSPRDAVEHGLDALSYAGNADVSTVFESGDLYEGHHSEWWGLYRSTVGPDTVLDPFEVDGDLTGTTYNGWARGDFLQNIFSAPNGIVGDVNQDGAVFGDGTGLWEDDDVTAFVEGWLTSGWSDSFEMYTHGDLNFDGTTSLADAYIMHQTLVDAGLSGLDFGLLSVPEPSTWMLLGLSAIISWSIRPRKQ